MKKEYLESAIISMKWNNSRIYPPSNVTIIVILDNGEVTKGKLYNGSFPFIFTEKGNIIDYDNVKFWVLW